MEISRQMLTEKKTEGSLSGSCSILISKSVAKENEISFGVCSSAGWEDKGLRKTNQDDWAIAWDGEEEDGDDSGNDASKNSNQEEKETKKTRVKDGNENKNEEEELKIFYAFVFDGHGEDGAAVSSFLRRVLPVVVQTKIQNMMKQYKIDEITQDLLEDVLIDTFIITNNALCELPPGLVETTYSGSAATGIIIFEYKSKIYLVSTNTGDSRAVWAKRVIGNKSGNGSFEIMNQSNDHKPDRQDEEKRINDMGGKVTRGRGVARVGGYALSRAFGDKVAHEDGLIVEPEIIVTELQNESEVLVILGSDGIWDFVSSEEAMDVFGKSISNNGKEGTLSEACDKASTEIVNMARLRWDAEYKSYVDDCTSLCIHIQIPNKQKQIKSKL